MGDYETIRLDVDEGRGTLQLDRPEKKNALSPTMYEEIGAAIAEAEASSADVLVITGTDDAFCAGNDLEAYLEQPRRTGPQRVAAVRETAGEVLTALHETDLLTIAQINGHVIGGGYLLQALCDLSIADRNATFCFSEINFGVFPGGGVLWAARKTMSYRDAFYYCATGEPFSGKEAEVMGAIHEAVPETDLDDRVAALVETLLETETLALRYLADLYDEIGTMSFEEARDLELAMVDQLNYYQGSEWIDEGIGQFREGEYRPGTGESYTKNDK